MYKTKVTTIKENLSARAAKELNEAMARAKTEKKTTETKAKNAKLRPIIIDLENKSFDMLLMEEDDLTFVLLVALFLAASAAWFAFLAAAAAAFLGVSGMMSLVRCEFFLVEINFFIGIFIKQLNKSTITTRKPWISSYMRSNTTTTSHTTNNTMLLSSVPTQLPRLYSHHHLQQRSKSTLAVDIEDRARRIDCIDRFVARKRIGNQLQICFNEV